VTTLRLSFFALVIASSIAAQGILDGLRDIVAGTATKLAATEIELRADPQAEVRSNESIVIQALVYGESPQGERVRIEKPGVVFSVSGEGDGWVSKPFRYQGEEPEGFYSGNRNGQLSSVFGASRAQYALQDSVLYTAPGSSGTYLVVAEVEGQRAEIEIRVATSATSTLEDETTNFPQEQRSRHPYRDLAEHYAPYVGQETWFNPKADYLARFDHDGDWHGDNNWENSPVGSSQAYVYYAAMETDTHWFVTYNFFHARDYSDKCVIGTCHENDNEGIFLTIQKDGSRYGRLRTLESLAHNNIYSFTSDRAIRDGAHGIDGEIEIYDRSHPVVFLEAGGHGAYGSTSSHSFFGLDDGFKSGTGVTYVYRGRAERPQSAVDREVGYELLEIYDHWWRRANDGSGKRDRTFDAYYVYQPLGRRSAPPQREIAGSFFGRQESENKAKPFWGWHDNKTLKGGLLATGQWGLDPAYGITQNLALPERVSTRYVYNPYLGIGEPARTPVSVPAAPQAPVARRTPPRSGRVASSAAEERLSPSPPRRDSGRLSPDLTSDRPRESTGGDAGQLEFAATVEGDMLVRVQEAGVELVVLSGDPVRIEGVSFESALPGAAVSEMELEKTGGRGDVVLLQRPSRANEFTAIVQITDDRDGSDQYGFRLTWRP